MRHEKTFCEGTVHQNSLRRDIVSKGREVLVDIVTRGYFHQIGSFLIPDFVSIRNYLEITEKKKKEKPHLCYVEYFNKRGWEEYRNMSVLH